MRLIRLCEHTGAILEEMYKGLTLEHKTMYLGRLSGVACPAPLSGEGDLDVFLPVMLDDNVQTCIQFRHWGPGTAL